MSDSQRVFLKNVWNLFFQDIFTVDFSSSLLALHLPFAQISITNNPHRFSIGLMPRLCNVQHSNETSFAINYYFDDDYDEDDTWHRTLSG